METVKIDSRLLIGVSDLSDGNIDVRFSDAAVVKKNRQALYSKLGLQANQIIEAEQIHFHRLLTIDRNNSKMWRGHCVTGVDGFLTHDSSIALMIRVADCLPLVLYDPEHHVVALVHAGWRGLTNAIHRQAVTNLMTTYQSQPKKLKAWIGPAIGRCCYTHSSIPEALQEPAWKAFRRRRRGQWSINLLAYLQTELKSLGVLKKNTLVSSRCTSCDSQLFSHFAAQTQSEKQGRFAVIVKLRS